MAYWLLKTEPEDYDFDQLLKDRTTVWDGVANNTALMHMRTAKKGDRALVYHTGSERAAVGLVSLTSGPYADPKLDDPKMVVFDVKAERRLAAPVTLAAAKADPALVSSDLVRLGRLSVVPLSGDQWKALLALAREK